MNPIDPRDPFDPTRGTTAGSSDLRRDFTAERRAYERALNDGPERLHEEPLSELLSEFAAESQRFLRAETTRAVGELKHEAKKAAAGAGMFAGAGVVGHTAFLCLCAALVIGLGHLIGFGWSALIVAAVLGIGAAVLAMSGRKAINNVSAPNVRAQLREDAAWLRDTTQTVKASRHADA